MFLGPKQLSLVSASSYEFQNLLLGQTPRLVHVKVGKGEFHDFRCTCLSRWLSNGLSEYDVMNLAGHAKFETTRQFYLAVREDLLRLSRANSTT